MKPVAGFHHVSLAVSDLDRSAAFYGELLGLTRLGGGLEWNDPDTGSRIACFGDADGTPGSLVELVQRASWQPISQGQSGAGGIHHHAFSVGTAEAQLRWKRWLEDRGVAVTGPYDRGWFRSIYFRDPDGQVLEVATRGPGYVLDEAADALGERVIVPAGAEERGSRDERAIRQRTHPEPVPAIDAGMRLDGLHHASGVTDDVERIGDFYEEALGLRRVKRSVNQDDMYTPHWFWASYDGAEVAARSSLTMFGGWEKGGAPLPGRMKRAVAGAGQTRHIAFRAADAEDMGARIEQLRTMRVPVSDLVERGAFRTVRFGAPDGLEMEIAMDDLNFGEGE